MEVTEGDNEYGELAGDELESWRVSVDAGSSGSQSAINFGFDGSTRVASHQLKDAAVLGQPVWTEDRKLAGVYSGQMNGYSLITRVDRIAESAHPVDPSHIVAAACPIFRSTQRCGSSRRQWESANRLCIPGRL